MVPMMAVTVAPALVQVVFVHELGNILDAKLNPNGANGRDREHTYGKPRDPWDTDTGMALEKCVLGGHQLP